VVYAADWVCADASVNEVADENCAEAVDVLNSLLSKVDGEEPPPDRMVPGCAEMQEVATRAADMITLLGLLQ
jgi:hypothetical protein